MAGVFPFREVKQGSRIVLYGAGALGKEFYMQIRDTKWCEIVAWVDQRFKGYKLKYPFEYVERINTYKDVDYYVVAIADYNVGVSIEQYLIDQGINKDRVIYHPGEYFKDYRMFPTDRSKYLTHLDEYMGLIDSYLDSDSIYAGKRWGFFYESFPGIGIDGVRSCQDRIDRYGLRGILKSNFSLLDIGCNSGFLALQVAPYVRKVVGIELDNKQVEVGKKAAGLAGVDNAELIAIDFNEYETNERFDVILCLAVHEYIVTSDETKNRFIRKIHEMLDVGGYFVFESQIRVDNLFYDLCDRFEEQMSIQRMGSYFETFHMSEREFKVYRKE